MGDAQISGQASANTYTVQLGLRPCYRSSMALSAFERIARQSIKRFIYSQLGLVEASKILKGDSKPLIRFTVEDSPPSVYLNFRIKDDKLAHLADALRLPDGLVLTPIRCRLGEDPFYALSLNIYRVSGLVNGLRAEWSVYVRDASGKPRYLIVEARSSTPSLDPVDLLTKKSRVEHALESSTLTSVVDSDGALFTSQLTFPEPGRALPFVSAPEWIEANDYIYWRNGVCDRAFYDGAMANGKMWELDRQSAELSDQTKWAAYLDARPQHIVALGGKVELVISPWWNV